MKYIRNILQVLLIVGIAVALCSSITGEQTPQKITWNVAEPADGSWSQTGEAAVFTTSMEELSVKTPTLLLQSQWPHYQILVDGTSVYTSSGIKNGAFHLFRLPVGQTLTVRFLNGDMQETSVRQSVVYLGSNGTIYRMLVQENLYSVIFWIFSLLLGTISIVAGFYLRNQRFRNIFNCLVSLGLYILLAGLWSLTDSKILLLFTQKSGFIACVSYLSFYALHIPLLQFTVTVLPARKKVLQLLQCLYIGMLLLLVVNFVCDLSCLTLLVLMEHVLMLVTLFLVLFFGFRELQRHRSKTLHRVMGGYVLFSICSVAAIILFYTANSRLSSPAYIVGVIGFMLFLADTAWLEIVAQIRENANVELYAQMAYRDVMTGIGNRAAFVENQQQLSHSSEALGYVMVDVNCLKSVNDTLGHQQGDSLIVQIAQCIQRAAEGYGSCYRIGGDEFVVCLKDSSEADVRSCAALIREEIRTAAAQSPLRFSAALGYAWSDQPDRSPDALIQQADNAMYAEKARMKASD